MREKIWGTILGCLLLALGSFLTAIFVLWMDGGWR